MSTLAIQLVPKDPANQRAYVWTSTWDAGTDTTPHVWIAQKRLRSGVVIFEVEAGNASMVVGSKARGEFPCSVQIDTQALALAGWAIEMDCPRAWPSTWPPMHTTFRRCAIYPASMPELQANAQHAARGVFNSIHQALGPANMPLPALTPLQMTQVRGTCGDRLNSIRTALMQGATAYINQEDGPQLPPRGGWRVHGPPRPDEVGGSGIFFDTGWQQCDEAVQLFLLEAEMADERAWHALDRTTGEPITADSYPDPGPKYVAGTGDPNNGWLPEFLGVAANPDPLPLCYDAAHSVRGFRFVVALCDMLDSAIVRRKLAQYAAQMRLQFSERGANPSGGYYPPTLRNSFYLAKACPNTGAGIEGGRIRGWGAFLMAAHLKYNGGSAGDQAWADMFLSWAKTCTPTNGIAQRVHHDPPKSGIDVWYDPAWDLAHAFEAPIWHYGHAALWRQRMPASPSRPIDTLEAAGDSLYRTARKGPYYSGEVGPMDYLFVAVRGGSPVPYVFDGKSYDPNVVGDATHCDAMCALLASDNPGADWRSISATVAHVTPDAASKKAWLYAQADLYGRAFLLAQLQAIS